MAAVTATGFVSVSCTEPKDTYEPLVSHWTALKSELESWEARYGAGAVAEFRQSAPKIRWRDNDVALTAWRAVALAFVAVLAGLASPELASRLDIWFQWVRTTVSDLTVDAVTKIHLGPELLEAIRLSLTNSMTLIEHIYENILTRIDVDVDDVDMTFADVDHSIAMQSSYCMSHFMTILALENQLVSPSATQSFVDGFIHPEQVETIRQGLVWIKMVPFLKKYNDAVSKINAYRNLDMWIKILAENKDESKISTDRVTLVSVYGPVVNAALLASKTPDREAFYMPVRLSVTAEPYVRTLVCGTETCNYVLQNCVGSIVAMHPELVTTKTPSSIC